MHPYIPGKQLAQLKKMSWETKYIFFIWAKFFPGNIGVHRDKFVLALYFVFPKKVFLDTFYSPWS